VGVREVSGFRVVCYWLVVSGRVSDEWCVVMMSFRGFEGEWCGVIIDGRSG